MMKSIVEEKLVSFKTLEQKVFRYVCELAQEITRIMLENYDAEQLCPESLPDEAGGWKEGLCVPAG